MKSLPRPLRDTTADLDVCIARAGEAVRPRLTDCRDDILTLFAHYEGEEGWDLDKTRPLAHIPPDVRGALRSSYGLTYAKRALKDLRIELLNVADNLCPYCRLEPPVTLDHFLPKSRFEPFAAFAPNLVPMCRTCNTLKGTKGSANARQFFTHAYFDALEDDEPYIIAQVSVGVRHIATNFLIDFSTPLDAGLFQRLAFQFSILRLVPRYQLEAVNVIYEQAVKLDEMVMDGCGIEDCRRSLQGDAKTEADIFGRSYWKAALLTALSANIDFCNEGFRRAL